MYANKFPLLLILFLFSLSACISHSPVVESSKRLTPAGKASEPKIPPGKLSEEANAIQLQLSRSQGKTEEDALFYLSNNSYGGEMMAGPYRIAFLIEKPKGYYQLANGQLEWQVPSGDAFLSVVVRDGYDGRTVPGLEIKVNIVNEFSKSVEKKTLPFGWFPLLNRYGDNVRIGRNGNYVLMVEIVPPTFPRQDHINGNRFPYTVKAEFENLHLRMQDLKEPIREDNKTEWLPLAKAQGKAVKLALENMIYSTAIDGSAVQKGDCLLAYAVEYAKGDWNFNKGMLEYESRIGKSTELNSYIEVMVMDAPTGRFLPGLKITSSLSLKNSPISTSHPEFKWHPWLYHYGKNIRVPRNSKEYTLKVLAEAPTYRRYGSDFGKIMATSVNFTFENVEIRTGRK